MAPEIDLSAFAAAHADGAVVIDVREPREYVSGHVPGALLLPLAQVHARLADLPHGVPIYVICATGNRSQTATTWLRAAGVDAVNVAGGTSGWQNQGHPVVVGAAPTSPLPDRPEARPDTVETLNA